MKHETMKFVDNTLKLIDQRKLPSQVEYFEADDYREVMFAISDMVVRGAPAIGATAAYGVYLAALEYMDAPKADFITSLSDAMEDLVEARPTAVNLSWAVHRFGDLLEKHEDRDVGEIVELIGREAERIAEEDVRINKSMARNGNELIPNPATILTHCNTGALATVGYGTALGVIREAYNSGKHIQVYADETRPRLQGARLTAFELVEENIPATLIVDSVAATLIRDGKVDIILVGADRIAANGDTANKIGTYGLSELATQHEVPFYVVAPTSTIDFDIQTGEEIDIEERPGDEVREIEGLRIAPREVEVYNPAFDVTPAGNITGIVTELGVTTPPFTESLTAFNDSN